MIKLAREAQWMLIEQKFEMDPLEMIACNLSEDCEEYAVKSDF